MFYQIRKQNCVDGMTDFNSSIDCANRDEQKNQTEVFGNDQKNVKKIGPIFNAFDAAVVIVVNVVVDVVVIVVDVIVDVVVVVDVDVVDNDVVVVFLK